MNVLEQFAAQINGDVFLREFSFAGSQFIAADGNTKEFADHVVLLDDSAIFFQLKLREGQAEATPETERDWFDNKVENRAVRQIRATLEFLRKEPTIPLLNQRNRRVEIIGQKISRVFAVAMYAPWLQPTSAYPKHYLSSKAGFIHIVQWNDWIRLCALLRTPAELMEYLGFREEVLQRVGNAVDWPSEAALAGQFVSEELAASPSESYTHALGALIDDTEEFSLASLLKSLGDRIAAEPMPPDGSAPAHYRILLEFAKLHRTALRHVKERFLLAVKRSKTDGSPLPTRVFVPETKCGFVIVSVPRAAFAHRVNGLKNLAMGAKYSHNSDRQIGIAVARDGEFIDITWCLLDYPWKPDPEIQQMLENHNPFPLVHWKREPRYTFFES